MEINRSEIVEEVRAKFASYESSLMANDVHALDGFFWDDGMVVRYGDAENLYGAEAIAAYRRSCAPPAVRQLRHTVLATFGQDFAVVSTEYGMKGSPSLGRQSQTWARLSDGWRIVAAHVSLIRSVDGELSR
ncbi:oxalurate catabolism protein HpxZ [soil metagenome]